MKTIKLPYKSEYDFTELLKQYNSVVRYSYNRFKEGKSQKEIEKLIPNLNHIDLLSKRIQLYGIKDGQFIHNKNKDNKVIFGGKFNFFQRLKNKITKEQFNEFKLLPITFQGEININGNRYFNFDFINSNSLILKLDRKTHNKLVLPKLKQNYNKILTKIETLSKLNELSYCIKISKTHVYISYDESLLNEHEEFKTFNNRVLGVDLNPNFIGCSIQENGKVIHKFGYDLSKLTVKSNESSQHKKSKYLNNKLKFEYHQIVQDIISKCKCYQVKNVIVESLHFKSNFKGKELNRLCKSKWLKTLFTNNLEKWCSIYKLNLIQINPCYSSLIGNILHKDFDPISSSIEIGRRGFESYIQKDRNKFYPEFNKEFIQEWCRRKNIILEGVVESWKELFHSLKNSKLKYRIPLEEIVPKSVFSLNSSKSLTNLFVFN
jgi:hypothetical protein